MFLVLQRVYFIFPGENMLENMGNAGHSTAIMGGNPSQFSTSLAQLSTMAPHSVSISADPHPSYPMYSHSTAVSMLPQMTMSHPIMQNLHEVRTNSFPAIMIEFHIQINSM